MAEGVDHILGRAADALDSGQRVAACLLTQTRGSTPADAGAIMIVTDAAEMHGTIGGGCVEAEVRRRVMTMITDHRSGVFEFQLDHDYGWDDGLLCGGRIDVAVAMLTDAANLREVASDYRARRETSLALDVQTDAGPARFVLDLPPRPRLLIAGTGHIGSMLARFALDLDFEVVVFDDRADLLERFVPEPAARIAGPIDEMIVREPIDDGTYIVIVTRGHRHDEKVLKAVVDRPARYIGMIGSRRKVKLIYDDLIESGVDEAQLQRVHAPIGIDIGSVTVNEIALSIVAQLVEIRRRDHASPVRGPFRIEKAETC